MLEILGLHAVPRNGPCLQNQPIQGSALLQDIWSGDREMQGRFATGEERILDMGVHQLGRQAHLPRILIHGHENDTVGSG